MNENRKDEMNYAAELAAKVEEKHMELDGACVLNIRSYQKFIKVYDLLKKLALLNDGGVASLSMEHDAEYAEISIEVPSIDLYKDGLHQFCGLLELVDLLDITNTGNDSVLIKTGIKDLWEAVDKFE